MKKILLLSIIALLGIVPAIAGKSKATTLTVSYVFKGIEEGYDHNTMGKLYIDDELVFETKEHKESKSQKFTVDVESGSHDILLEIWNEYEGEWEIHNVENNYSIDAVLEENFRLKKGKNTLTVVFDLDDETTYSLK